jgi:hypothetical protein
VLAESDRFLRLSYFITPFYSDDAKRLLTPVPPEEIRQVFLPNGEPVNPGIILKVLPAGRPAKILGLEFPGAITLTERYSDTPRFQPWLYVGVKDEPADTPLVIVLRQGLSSHQEIQSEVDRYLSRTDIDALFHGLTEGMVTAVRNKKVVLDMPADAVEMAWGYPELKRITFEEGGGRKETWIYGQGARKVVLIEGRAVSIEPAPLR